MQPDNYNVILSRFAPWLRVPCWVMCNADKQPATIHSGHYSTEPERDYGVGDMLRWQAEPQDHITTLNTVIDVVGMMPGYGIGPIIGRGNTLACFDFDHCLDKNGNIISEKIRAFVEVIGSYTEVSVSGTGIHCFVVSDEPETEYGFHPEYIGDGKFYSSRFIRLTGNEHRDYSFPIKCMSHDKYLDYKKFLEHQVTKPTAVTIPRTGTYTGSQDWNQILDDAGIIHQEVTSYAGMVRHYTDGTSRTVDRAWRILCPNYRQHGNHNRRNKAVVSGGGDVAILTKFKDGMSAVKCHHNHCNPLKYDVNLLKMLWTQIKQNRADAAREYFKNRGGS